MKIPNKLRILGRTFKVVSKPALLDENGQGLYGRCEVHNEVIYICTEASQSTQETTFIHEVIEALNTMLELGMEHHVIQALETGLYQVLKDNKLLKEDK